MNMMAGTYTACKKPAPEIEGVKALVGQNIVASYRRMVKIL